MPNATLVNFAAGETSPKSRGRFDIASYNSSCRKMENFIAEVTGAARYRNGFKHLAETAAGGAARLIPFQFNDEQSYMLEFTNLKLRVYKNGELQTVLTTTVTGISNAVNSELTVTSATALVDGDEIIMTGIVGMTELNGRCVKLGNKSGSTFRLYDPITNTPIDTTTFGVWSSGGLVYEVYTVATPYLTEDLEYISYAQTAGTMYVAHYRYAPRKITINNFGVVTVATYTRTNDPFTVTPVAIANPASIEATPGLVPIITFTGTLPVDGELYTVTGVAAGDWGTFLNTKTFRLQQSGSTFTLRDATTGEQVYTVAEWAAITYPTTATGTWTSEAADHPVSVAFFENRLVFAGTNVRPRTVFMSRSPISTTGESRLDDFTGGADVDHACFFSLAPVNGTLDYINWSGGTSKYLLVGTFGGVFRVSGGGLDEPITPASISVRQLDSYGCAATAPAINGVTAYYIQRGGKTIRGVRYDADVDDFSSFDLCLNAEQIGDSEITSVIFQAGRPEALWVVRSDGQLCGCTIQGAERITGWHRHKMGGTAGKVIDVAILSRPGLSDQLYGVTSRTVNGATRRAVEAMADEVVFPDIEDYYTAVAAAATDAATYRAAVNALLKTAVHLDAYETYISTPATLIQGLHHLEGQTVETLADGVHRTGLVVTNGAITLPVAASVVHAGLPYDGYIQTQNLEMGGRTGPAQAKPRNICAFNIRFLNSLGGEYGTDLYRMQAITDGLLDLNDGSPAPIFSGILKLQYSDNWSTETERNEKTVFIAQRSPLPCVVQFIDLEYETGDE